MPLENLKEKANDSVKKLSHNMRQKKKSKILSIVILVSLSIFVILLVVFLLNIKNLFFHIAPKTEIENNNIVFKMAEEAYNNGYLENSAINYQRYIKSEKSKVKKIIAYKRLFEISVLKNEMNKALFYLDKIESIDKKVYELYINRIKIYLRLKEYTKAHNEIIRNKQKLKKSNEYNEIVSVYYFKTQDYNSALESLKNIPYKKREFNVHKKIIHCYLNLKEFDKCIEYIKKIEKKILLIGDKDTEAELIILKEVVNILNGDLSNSAHELKRANSISSKYDDITFKLLLYTALFYEDEKEIYDITDNNVNKIYSDLTFLKLLANFYLYKEDYLNSLFYFKKIEDLKELTKEEIMIISELYFYNGEYEKSISYMNDLYMKFNYRLPILYKNISLAYNKLGDHENEIFYLKEGLMVYPKELDFYIMLTKKYIDLKDYDAALKYISNAKTMYNNSDDIIYDKRLDALYVLAKQKSKNEMSENELLTLREKETTNPDYYFNIIKYYILKRNFIDAQRELNTVSELSLDDSQKKILNTYKLIISLYTDDQNTYIETKKLLFNIQNKTIIDKINLAIIYIIDNNYEDALIMLDSISIDSDSKEYNDKIIFYKSVCYFYKREYLLSQKTLNMISDKEKSSRKVIYLKNLIRNKFGDIE